MPSKAELERRRLLGERNFRHGLVDTPTYKSWRAMVQRCTYPKHVAFPRYGGRGITVCAQWRKFENFVADMGIRRFGLTLERKDNAGNYEPGNCKWATWAEQSRNSKLNVFLVYQGLRLCLTDWSRKTGIGITTLLWRLNHKWPIRKVLDRDCSYGKASRRKTHCPAGHPYNKLNTCFAQNGGGRKCRECSKLRSRRWRKQHPQPHLESR